MFFLSDIQGLLHATGYAQFKMGFSPTSQLQPFRGIEEGLYCELFSTHHVGNQQE
jgi:hypothetical protein